MSGPVSETSATGELNSSGSRKSAASAIVALDSKSARSTISALLSIGEGAEL